MPGFDGRLALLRALCGLALVIAVPVCACTTARPVQGHEGQRLAGVKPGDRVVVRTIDGETHKFRVLGVSEDALVGDNLRVDAGKIASLEVRRYSAAKTAGLVLGVAAGVAAGVVMVEVVVGFSAW